MNSIHNISESEFMQLQISEINKYKWIRSEQVGYDMGREAVLEWIMLYAADFRKKYFK